MKTMGIYFPVSEQIAKVILTKKMTFLEFGFKTSYYIQICILP